LINPYETSRRLLHFNLVWTFTQYYHHFKASHTTTHRDNTTITMFCRIIALLAVAASVVSAEMIPTSPDGATVAKIGDQLTTLWTKDTSGEWNNGE
jgi:hypothetical protein